MSKKPPLLLLFSIVIFLIPALACSTLKAFTEETSISIVSPDPEVRIVDEFHKDGTPVQTNLSVRMNTNTDRYIPATIYLNGVAKPDICILAPNETTNCGALDLYNQGQQTVRVEVAKLNGEVLVAEIVFLWEPYIGWDAVALKLAQVVGSNSPTIGFFLFGIMFLVVLNILILAVFKSSQSVVLGIFASTIILIILFIRNDPKVAADLFLALIALVSSSILAGVVVYGMSKNYGLGNKRGTYLNLPGPNGPIIIDDKASSWLSNNNGQGQTAEIIKAYLDASARAGAPNSGVTHYIDGQIISEEQFKLMTGQKQAPVAPRRGFIPWLLGAGKRRNQKLLR